MRTVTITLLLLGLTTAVVISAKMYKPSYRPITVEEAKDLYQATATGHMLNALKYASFAAQLDCPCYDVTISTITGGVNIEVNKDRCPETVGK